MRAIIQAYRKSKTYRLDVISELPFNYRKNWIIIPITCKRQTVGHQ